MSLIDIDRDAAAGFPDRPFRIRHHLSDHPLLSLDALAGLAGRLDRDRVEYNSGRLEPNQPPDQVPGIDLPPAEVVRQIATCGAWMVLKNVETVPEYAALIRAALADARAAIGGSGDETGMQDFQGFIFVSSANGVTPFHIDYEENFFVHLHGEKFMHVFDNRDRALVPEADLETYPGKHRNLSYLAHFEERATVFRFAPGEGMFLPYTWPHWVRTGDDWTISMAITWKSRRDIRMNRLYLANAVLRKLHLPQPAPGRHPLLDGAKTMALGVAQSVIKPLRRSEGMRRRLRSLFFGRRANYYYGEGKT
ncbi:MAG: cupin-like domain-containing protein [Bauldia sp.]|uniref:cupin-like domain-containing protein n=1 Tax=Bauldia sp. TaxID=2575872 RepID=UPI001DFE95FA|nr:cupin-like domain-containing protein [Bauldia sp.]MCB1494669.1 cupin-like domain-containing protein [Bauldia sp.]